MSLNLSISEKELSKFNRIGVAYSGGVDSHSLLKRLSELNLNKKNIYALHVNHGINEESDSWEKHCKGVAEGLGVNFQSYSLNLPKGSSEDEMRSLRYEKLENWFLDGDVILTAHHKEDQMETILFRLFRGTSIKGLTGIPNTKEDSRFILMRPLLDTDKTDILEFARERKLNWIEDLSNKDDYFSRNYIRNKIIPVILKRWPNLSKAIEFISRESLQATFLLNERAKEDIDKATLGEELSLKYLSRLSDPRLRNLFRFWLDSMNINPTSSVVSEIISSFMNAKIDSSPIIRLKDSKGNKFEMRRYNGKITLLPEETSDHRLNIKLCWDISDELRLDTGVLKATKNKGKGISPALVKSNLEVRSRIGGEKFCPAEKDKTKSLKKLYQESKIPPWARDRIPLIYVENKLAAVPSLWISKEFSVSAEEEGIDFIWKDKLGT